MKPNEIHLNDWSRIFVGNVPGSFYIEIAIRLIFLYFLLLLCMRLMGKRMASRLSRNEFAAMVVMAAAIGIPILSPDRGLIPAVIISVIVVLTERGISMLAFKRQGFEKFSQGNIDVLVTDSVMNIDSMTRARISSDRLLGEIRSKGISHLGHINRLYLEAGGGFAIIKHDQPQPGLSVIPDWDIDFVNEQTSVPEVQVCKNCGNKRKEDNAGCSNCHKNDWIAAIK